MQCKSFSITTQSSSSYAKLGMLENSKRESQETVLRTSSVAGHGLEAPALIENTFTEY